MEQSTISQQQNRTKKHLQLALIEQIKEKGYHSVTVKDIVERAAYNRSTFYVHYQDKIELTVELLDSMLKGLEHSVAVPYVPGRKIYTKRMNASYFNIVTYIYENRNFFELLKVEDSLPGLHTGFEQTILTIYQKHFKFETINKTPVNMEYFTRYTAYGFSGLLKNWITNGFKEGREEFIQEVIDLAATHIQAVEYVGKRVEAESGD
jgi:AcrR family transcriptional regulator